MPKPKPIHMPKLVHWEKTGTVLRLKAGTRAIAYVYQYAPDRFEATNIDTGEYRDDCKDQEDAKDWAVTSCRNYCARVLGSFCAV